ncbi:MAG: MOSC domain-containing protein [Gemmatimonadaceae bacterium]|nr:MOSC domain-containing protein [Gemmatimonadaceae bacterium]
MIGSPPTVQLRSLNVGAIERLTAERPLRSGIRKHSVQGPVLCDTEGLVGDAIGNRTHHGGPEQALYLYSASDYAWWTTELGRECGPGLFGENLTLDAWWPAPRVGDRVQLGEVLLELTAPRIPCNTLATRMGDPQFVRRFARAVRPGAYVRVLQTGVLEAGMTGVVTRGNAEWPSIDALFRLWHETPRDKAALMAALRAPLASRARDAFMTWVAGN